MRYAETPPELSFYFTFGGQAEVEADMGGGIHQGSQDSCWDIIGKKSSRLPSHEKKLNKNHTFLGEVGGGGVRRVRLSSECKPCKQRGGGDRFQSTGVVLRYNSVAFQVGRQTVRGMESQKGTEINKIPFYFCIY